MPSKNTPLKKILIANRGEIACRVIDTCGKMGIATVAVYSDADAQALHVERADQTVHIGPSPARESYLVMEKIIAAAKQAGADAIHPGYGFLSENEDFATACAAAGIVFIGPPVAAIRAMGGKSEAKALMEKAGVPLVPGYHGDNQDAAFLAQQADKMGYPVLIKASAGGGGKGMRVVETPGGFAEALASAKREAQAAFGDDHVLVEKYLTSPRHVEIQVFADQAGNTVYLFERDCSVQRRHQKVLEEAPAPGLAPDIREKMGQAAVAAAKAIGYVGAGTVEFLLDTDGRFYFMEMNTRLQVEHPVTEMVTGLDLVELQIRVAQGEKLPFTQADLALRGHAVEVRLYAEDPDNNFLPGAGQIRFLRFADTSETLRVDTGVRETASPGTSGDVVSIHYDPMIAKIIAHGKDRAEAIDRLAAALDDTLVAGPKTNIAFLRVLLAHPDFRAGTLSTRFIQLHEKALLPGRQTPEDSVFELAALALYIRRAAAPRRAVRAVASSPWDDLGGWRLGGPVSEAYVFRETAGDRTVVITPQPGDHACVSLQLDGGSSRQAEFMSPPWDGSVDLRVDGVYHNVVVLQDGRHLTVLTRGVQAELTYLDPLAYDAGEDAHAGRLTAPMPGKVVAVRVQLGDAVKKGQPLIIVEAMKMEHTINAPADGTVAAINANVGDQVDEKLELIAFT